MKYQHERPPVNQRYITDPVPRPPWNTQNQQPDLWQRSDCQRLCVDGPQNRESCSSLTEYEPSARYTAQKDASVYNVARLRSPPSPRVPLLPKLRVVRSSSELREQAHVIETSSTLSPATPFDTSYDAVDAFLSTYETCLGQVSASYAATISDTSKFKISSAFEEASYFLGGLIKHPTESTKHFTILRHSHGLVYYKGPTTSISLTIFSDKPLPPDRRYWLQRRGWVGNTGMKLEGLFRASGDWIDVTPTRRIKAEELSPSDERSWQRDIKSFVKGQPKLSKSHTVRETIVLRIPADAVDGYIRTVLTTTERKNILCPSPVFRVASTSMSASSIKGASLTTLPLELGLHVMQFAATQTANKVIDPWFASVRKGASRIAPASAQAYARGVHTTIDVQNPWDTVNQQYDSRRELLAKQTPEIHELCVPVYRPDTVGNSIGPEAPFPYHLKGTIARGSGRSLHETGMPTANLTNFTGSKVLTLLGVYFGWAFVIPSNPMSGDMHNIWRHAIITITHDNHGKVSIAASKIVHAYLLHNYGGQDFSSSTMSLIIMGYLRPYIPYSDKAAFFTETMRDIEITRASLEREQWSSEYTHRSVKKAKSERNLVDRYVDARIVAQEHFDSIPLHKLGIRTESVGLKDRMMHGNGGLYVRRDGS